MILGAQLYTVREFTKSFSALNETLAKVADIGYTTVQLSATCPYDAEWMKKTLAKYGLSAPLTHFDFQKLTEQPEETAAFHKAFGADYVGIGCSPFSFDQAGLDQLIASLEHIGVFRENGMKVMYHNHNMEFSKIGKRLFLEHLLDAFSDDTLGVTLDTYWAQAAGADPAAWCEKLKGRIDCIHLKDMCYSGEDHAVRMAAVGSGNMNFERILASAESAGTRYAFVEQDNCYGEDPFDALKQSYDYLKALGLS